MNSQPLAISGSGSKAFLGGLREDRGRLLSLTEHSGIVDYRPDELVITARAGTPLRELTQTLARESQMLTFEPPISTSCSGCAG